MANLTPYEPKTIAPPTKEEKAAAHKTHSQILAVMQETKAAESELERNYVTIGQLAFTMQEKAYWLILGYASWRDYFTFIQDKFGKGRTQLYSYIGTMKTLSPHVDNETLLEMGISKAKELRRAVDQTGKAPSEELLAKAKDQKVLVSDFREAVQKEFQIVDHNEKGTWTDLGGVFFTPEEKDEWESAIDLAKNQDPVISVTLANHVQFKEAILRLAQEFIGTYGVVEQQDTKVKIINAVGQAFNIEGFNEVFQTANSSQSELEEI